MGIILSIIQTLFRHRWFIVLTVVLCTLAAIFHTRNMRGSYTVKATLYTGVASGYHLESDKRVDWGMVQNSMDNLISIIEAESTLKRVSLRLFARVLMMGSPDREQNGITPESYRSTYLHVKHSPHGQEILALIDKNSEDKSVENLERYMKPQRSNYIYGLFFYDHLYYSYDALRKVRIQRRLTSDLLDISYDSGDPGISYQTVTILMSEFVKEYQRIRYGEADKVILYFEEELKRIGAQLHREEQELTKYNVEKRVINYTDETKEIAAINKEFELREQVSLFTYNSSKAMLAELDKLLGDNTRQLLTNIEFVNKLKEASNLTTSLAKAEKGTTDDSLQGAAIKEEKERLDAVKKEMSQLIDSYVGGQHTKEGSARNAIILQWLEQKLLHEKAAAELQVAQEARQRLNDRYVFFAPVGTTIRQKERSINFTERNYLSVLQSYNEALLKRKNLEMTSATLKVLNEPAYPISPNATNRKQIVVVVFAGSFLFIVGLLILVELLDRTLRDARRSLRVSGFAVLGALPDPSSTRYGKMTATYLRIAVRDLSNSLLRFLGKRQSPGIFILNLLSTTEGGKEKETGKLICQYLKSRGLRTSFIAYGENFSTESESYLLAQSVTDFYTLKGEDILIVAYPPLSNSNIPNALLRDANANLLVTSAQRGWKAVDRQLCEQLMLQLGPATDTPFRICLSDARRPAIEDFTGQLPPYTWLRRLGYHLGQLSLTEGLIFHGRRGRKPTKK
jgi:uncharacterized protein involved in exopolysaccharide biosynthesis